MFRAGKKLKHAQFQVFRDSSAPDVVIYYMYVRTSFFDDRERAEGEFPQFFIRPTYLF